MPENGPVTHRSPRRSRGHLGGDRVLAAGLVTGALLDALLGDPKRAHPVALFGTAATAVQRRCYADHRLAGVGYALVTSGAVTVGATVLDRLGAHRPAVRYLLATAATFTALGGTTLRREAAQLAALLDESPAADLGPARARLTHLVGRDPSALDASGISRAVVESVAENTSDAVVGPLFWAGVAGVPGLIGYRAVNTLDAMVGHHSPRYEHFGWASARLDDVANLVPARVTAALACLLAPLVGGRIAATADITRRFGSRHPSPNSGWCEASFAGALDLTLGGRNVYPSRVEDRPLLGAGRHAEPGDIARANRLSAAVSAASVALAATAIAAVGRRPRTNPIRPHGWDRLAATSRRAPHR